MTATRAQLITMHFIHSLLQNICYHAIGRVTLILYYYVVCMCVCYVVKFVKQFSLFFGQSGQAAVALKTKTRKIMLAVKRKDFGYQYYCICDHCVC